MKLLIASDIHGSALFCRQLLDRVEAENPDKLLLLGDLLYHGPRNDLPRDYAPKEVIPMLNSLKNRLCCVRGNCDAEVDQMVLDFPVMADYCILPAGGAGPHPLCHPWPPVESRPSASSGFRRCLSIWTHPYQSRPQSPWGFDPKPGQRLHSQRRQSQLPDLPGW